MSIKKQERLSIKRIVCMIIGVAAIGIGVACLRMADFGTDPFSSMNIGISNLLPLSYGTYNAIVNIVLFIPVIMIKPNSFGIGALFNMLGVGYIVDGTMWIFKNVGLTIESIKALWFVRGLFLVAGILFISFGVALYMKTDLGVAPYDMIGQIVEDLSKGKIPFKLARVSEDIFSMVVGLIVKGPFGAATFVVAFFTGPLVSWFKEHVVSRILD